MNQFSRYASCRERNLFPRHGINSFHASSPLRERKAAISHRWQIRAKCNANHRPEDRLQFLCIAHHRRELTLIVATLGFDYPLPGGHIYEARRTSGKSGEYVASAFRRATNDSHARSRDAVTLSSVSTTDPDQNNESSGRFAARFVIFLGNYSDFHNN